MYAHFGTVILTWRIEFWISDLLAKSRSRRGQTTGSTKSWRNQFGVSVKIYRFNMTISYNEVTFNWYAQLIIYFEDFKQNCGIYLLISYIVSLVFFCYL